MMPLVSVATKDNPESCDGPCVTLSLRQIYPESCRFSSQLGERSGFTFEMRFAGSKSASAAAVWKRSKIGRQASSGHPQDLL